MEYSKIKIGKECFCVLTHTSPATILVKKVKIVGVCKEDLRVWVQPEFNPHPAFALYCDGEIVQVDKLSLFETEEECRDYLASIIQLCIGQNNLKSYFEEGEDQCDKQD